MPARKWLRRVAIILLSLVLTAYVGTCVWLKVNEHRLIFGRHEQGFPGVPISKSLALQPKTVQIGTLGPLPLFAGSISSSPADSVGNWILYFHGGGGKAATRDHEVHHLQDMGFNILAAEYPGYAGTPGQSTEQVVEQEAQIAYEYLRKTGNVAERNIVIYGGSLGTGVAVDLASHVRAAALVLVAPYTSVLENAKLQHPFIPVSLLLSDRLESDRKIPAVHMPVFIFHTVEDKIIPFEQGRRLYELAGNPKHFEEAHGPHGQTSYSFYVSLEGFLNAYAGLKVRAPRKPISSVLAGTIEGQGVQAAILQYRELRAQHGDEYDFVAYELNVLGYDLLDKGRTADAIAILKLNAEQYPTLSNVYDSLGDAYLRAGDKKEAEQNFQRSLQIYPAADNYSREKLYALLASTRNQ